MFLSNAVQKANPFLSIQAQDFIEDRKRRGYMGRMVIPEHSSSGLH